MSEEESARCIMRELDLGTAGSYLFFIVILLQNTVALAFTATGLDVPVFLFYALKFLLALAIVWLLLVTKTLPRVGKVDRGGFLFVFVILCAVLFKGGGLRYETGELAFYFAPAVIYFVGRTMAPFRNDRQLAHFLITLGVIYVTLGATYALVGRKTLADNGLKTLLTQRQSDVGRGDEPLIDGLPENFWAQRADGQIFPRAFGALFEPLASAFFGATLVLYLWEVHRRRIVRGAGYLAAAAALLVALTICRSIIIGMLLICLASLLHKKGLIALPIWPILVVGLGGVGFVFANLNRILPAVDPSSGGHLMAYANLNSAKTLLSAFGHRFENGTPRGEESLYSTMLFECGIVGITSFVIWCLEIYSRLRRFSGQWYARPMFESLVVYILASFTTEHWFALSSCSIFWFLLGNNITVTEEGKGRILQDRPGPNHVFVNGETNSIMG